MAPAAAYCAVVSAESWLPGAVMRSTPDGIARANVETQYCSTEVPFIVVSPASSTICAPDSSVSEVMSGAIPTLQCRSEMTRRVTGSASSEGPGDADAVGVGDVGVGDVVGPAEVVGDADGPAGVGGASARTASRSAQAATSESSAAR